MKYLLGTIAVIVLAAAAAGWVCYRLSGDSALHAAAQKGDAMQWLRDDFHLDDRQFAAIRALHDAYAGTCAEHCRMIQEANKARDVLVAARGGDPAAVTAAEARVQALRAVCESAITAHVRKVAALMSPEDGRSYLALVLPKISDFDHTAAPDLRLNAPR
jgi:hypothetical protein